MDVSDHLPKMRIVANQPGFVPVLEKMSDTIMASIEIFRISGQQAPHEGREFTVVALNEKMEMVRHQRPCKTADSPAGQIFSDTFQEFP